MLTNSHVIYGNFIKDSYDATNLASKLNDLIKKVELLEKVSYQTVHYSYDSSNFLVESSDCYIFKSENLIKNVELLGKFLSIDGIIQDFEFFEVSLNLDLSATELKVVKKCFPINHLKQPCRIILVLFLKYLI
jgi:hypothetical protein